MRPALFIYDDARAQEFEPFALTRPAASLTAGAAPIWVRWQMSLQCPVAGLIGTPHLDGFDDGFSRGTGTAPRMTSGEIPAGSIIANSRFAASAEIHALRNVDPSTPGADELLPASSVGVWRGDGRVVAVRTTRAIPLGELRDGSLELESLVPESTAEETLRGWWLDEVWDLVRLLPELLADDLHLLAEGPFGRGATQHFDGPPPSATVIGTHPVLLAKMIAHRDGSVAFPAPIIEPHVVLDATAGPIVIMHGASVHAFTRLNGPCYIGDGTTVMGGELSTCSIGPLCKVRGEMSHTIMCGYANKGHDGFVGHSYLGRWTNLGAGTITSNLKNTYGSVTMWTPDGVRDTGMQFLGTLFGDHAKTGIGMRLTTGTVLGAGANVYGSNMPPKCVPPFAWGEKPPYATYRLEKFMDVAERVMARRKRALSEDCRRQLATAYAARWTVDGEKGS